VTRRKQAPTWIVFIHLVALTPLVVLGIAMFTGALGPDPIGAATRRTGRYALATLFIVLTLGPLANLAGLRQALRARRALGLYAFLYAGVHFLIYLGWDFGFAWALALRAIRESPFIWMGAWALLILTALAVTSTRGWQARLGAHWRRLHRLVYLASVLAGIHYLWVFKELRLLPMLYLGAVALLLVLRIPAVARPLRRLLRG
jgi:sulfoxide reductase heme-binding subunit YedZ